MAMLTVKTNCGSVRGIPGTDPSISVFKGIPYAAPPIGTLRFAPPRPVKPWEGELLCDHYGASSLQELRPGRELEMSEDCLTLNIWTPANSTDEKLPVMFWVHGGGFIGGTGCSPTFDGELLGKKGVILVTFNYRLGALGFLALPELAERDGATGNSGLLDQMAALRWVKTNIEAFGGDKDNITIFGFSAGGMSVRMLMSSPLSRDMISHAIVQSGSGITDSDYYRPLEEKIAICKRGMERLGWTMEDIMTRDAREVNEKLQEATIGELEFWEKSVFQPNTDGISLLETPGVTIWKGEAADVPVMAGSVTGDNGWIKIVKKDVDDDEILRSFVYSRGVAWAERNVQTERRPIFTYHFERTQPEKYWGSPTNKTPHGSDIPYVMGTINHDEFTDYDFELSNLIASYWANFARTGNPNGDGLMEWPTYTKEHPVSLHIDDEGYRIEELAKTESAKRGIQFVVNHPGVIKDVKDL